MNEALCQLLLYFILKLLACDKTTEYQNLWICHGIQRKRKCIRSKSLLAARAILQNEDIAVYYLVKRQSYNHFANKLKREAVGSYRW